MLNSIHIQNFKSHRDTFLELKNLTILCGQNAVGKSSVFQSLLLLRQTHQKNRLLSGLSLNKPLCYIGSGRDALYQFAETDKISFEIKTTENVFKWIFNTKKSLNSDFLENDENFNDDVAKNTRDMLAQNSIKISFFGNNFQYISAARVSDYEADDFTVETEKQISIEEGKAELVAHFLFRYRDDPVLDDILHPLKKETNSLLDQVIAWEREISEGVDIIPVKVGRSYDILYSFEIKNSPINKTNEFSTKNVGFGLSYTLPILVAILSAPKGSLILIENPEAHLHPAAQSKLAELMCIAAQAGIQLIIETHSDHIINGVMVQCKRFETESRGIDRNNVKVYYFDKDENKKEVKTTEVELNQGGRIKNAPPGFFDQMGKDLRVLMSTSKKKNE